MRSLVQNKIPNSVVYLVVLQILDIITTVIGVSNGAQELNPIMATDINYNIYFFIGIKIVMTIIFAHVCRVKFNELYRVIVLFNIIMTLVVLNNLVMTYMIFK